MDMGLVVFGTTTDIAVTSGDRSGAECVFGCGLVLVGRLSS
jgi:hypothetical protein